VKSYWARPADPVEVRSGHKDEVLAARETARTLEEMKWVCPEATEVLNIGAGNPAMVELYSNGYFQFTHMDLDPCCSRVEKGSILHLPLDAAVFPAVLAKRVLCCLPPDEQFRAVKEVERALRPNGNFFLADVWSEERELLQKAREQAGLERLPAPKHNYQLGQGLLERIQEETGLAVIREVPLAKDYLLWTRLLLPMLLGRDDPFARHELRRAAPMFSKTADGLAFHRLYVFRKVNY
jgi:SAM-dependent methyltransferase